MQRSNIGAGAGATGDVDEQVQVEMWQKRNAPPAALWLRGMGNTAMGAEGSCEDTGGIKMLNLIKNCRIDSITQI